MRTRWLYAGAVALLALTGGTAAAQGNGNGRGRENAPGQVKKADRQAATRFADRDRAAANSYYTSHRSAPPRGLRDRDRIPQEQRARITPGYQFDRSTRSQVYAAPYAMTRGFQPAPYGYRYVVYGGQVMMVDDAYRVSDVISLNISF